MRLRLVVLAALSAVLAGCGAGKETGAFPKTVIGTLPQATPVAKGDPAAGKSLYDAQGCGGCHTYGPAGSSGKVGPDLDNLVADAQKANQGSVADYTATSIENPSAYVVPGYQDGVMPGFSQLTSKQIGDLVAFLTQGS